MVFPRDLNLFYDRFSESMPQPYTRSQLSEKLCRLCKKYRIMSGRISREQGPSRLAPHDRDLLHLCTHLWHPSYASSSPFSSPDAAAPGSGGNKCRRPNPRASSSRRTPLVSLPMTATSSTSAPAFGTPPTPPPPLSPPPTPPHLAVEATSAAAPTLAPPPAAPEPRHMLADSDNGDLVPGGIVDEANGEGLVAGGAVEGLVGDQGSDGEVPDVITSDAPPLDLGGAGEHVELTDGGAAVEHADDAVELVLNDVVKLGGRLSG